jgi:RHS repeat-associated protein
MVWKEISRRGAEAQSWEVEQTASILWDGYNIVQALSHSQTHTLTNFHIWGLDLSGSLQGAGGVGGLLAEVHDGEPYYAAYDANGNVTEYLTTDGTIAAHYEYSPFGEIVVQSGDLADSFTHRFSTKPCCAVTGLSEYEYRKYSPSVGRWMSRDPNTETSSEPHLTTIVKNSSVNRIDHLGKYSIGQVEIGNGSFEGHGECCDQGTLLAHIRNSGLEDAISAIGKRTSDGTPQGRRCLRKISCGKCNDVTHPGASRPCPRCSGRAAGFYDASTGEITLCGYPSPDRLRHELQHAYQCRKAPPCGTTQNDNDCFMLIKMEIASYICGGDDYFGPPNACSDVSTDAGRRDCASAVVNAYVGLNAPFEERIHYPCRKMCAGFYSFDSTINRWAVPDAILNTLVEFIRTPGFHCATTPQQPNE